MRQHAVVPLPVAAAAAAAASEIAGLLPGHDHFVDPVGCGMDVLFAKAPSKSETVNDDGALHTFWKVLRERPVDLARVCVLSPHSRAEHADAVRGSAGGSGSQPCRDRELERARQVWVWMCQSKACENRTARPAWRSWVSGGAVIAGLDGYVERMAWAADRLHRVSLDCRQPLVVLKEWRPRRQLCVYVDLRDDTTWWTAMTAMKSGHDALLGVLHDYPAPVVIRTGADAVLPWQDWAGVRVSADDTALWSQQPLVAQPPLFAVESNTAPRRGR